MREEALCEAEMAQEEVNWMENNIMTSRVFKHSLVILGELLALIGFSWVFLRASPQGVDMLDGVIFIVVIISAIIYTLISLKNAFGETPRRVGTSLKGIHIVNRRNMEESFPGKNSLS